MVGELDIDLVVGKQVLVLIGVIAIGDVTTQYRPLFEALDALLAIRTSLVSGP